MARGGVRPGAGRPRKPLEWHLRNRTYRADRHGPLPVHLRAGVAAGKVAVMPQPTDDWQPTPAERRGLSRRAQARLDLTLAEFQLDPLDGARLLDALRSLSRCERLETALARTGVTTERSDRLLRALAREQRIFLSLWAALQLPRRSDGYETTDS